MFVLSDLTNIDGKISEMKKKPTSITAKIQKSVIPEIQEVKIEKPPEQLHRGCLGRQIFRDLLF